MSLHLIESRRVVSRTSRKRDGMFVSVTVHALLIVSTFTLATASPVATTVRKVDDIVYVEPPHPVEPVLQKLQQSTSTPANHQLLPAAPNQPILIAPVDIPAIIPEINIMQTADLPITRRTSAGTTASNSTGGTGTGDSGNGAIAILGELQVDRPVSILSGYRTPRYPEALRAAGVQQTLNVEFVVDTLGRIEANSLTFRDNPHESFTNAVREALRNAKFRPAEVTGRRVRQRVSQAFVFSLNR
ncbi:MAG: TonB family protein [Phycisphaerae bacterium]|nr:TonB family protein [Gemmatimonadaceae bacterium]